MITEESVREVIDTARIEDVVGDFVNLRRRGNNLTGLCPFHNEKTPSFNVNPARNIYKCFGCGEGGDAIKFLMELEQLTFPDAIRWIARKYNLKLEEQVVSEEVREELQERDSLIITNDFARRYFEDQLHNTDEGKSVALSYFRGRGFRREVMETFGLGYAPHARDGLLRAATAAGHKADRLEQLGLVRNGRDFFFDRVMFTIHDLGGKPIAFAGRVLRKDVKAPKYVNSPESEIYHKSDVLYGMFQARRAVRKLDNVYLVEGYTDVISLHQNGIENVVATSGTSLTAGQARVVKRFTENVTLLYDGDRAGIKAALRGVDVLLIAGLNVRVVVLPDREDPDSYLQSVGTTAFESYLTDERKDFLFFKADLLLEEAGTDVAARTDAIRGIGQTLALVEDPLKRAGYLQQFSARLGIEEQLLVNLVNRAVADRRTQARKEQEREARRNRRAAGPAAPQSPGRKPAPPVDPEDDGWAGLTEPAWEGFSENDTAPAPRRPPTEAGAQAGPTAGLPETGHGFQERHLAHLLVQHGHKVYDAASNTSIAAYLTANVADILGDFERESYRHIVNLVTDQLRQNGSGPGPDWFLGHPEADVRELATEATMTPYTYSPNWKEKYGLRLSQKRPEENHRLAAEMFLRNFRRIKLEAKRRVVLQKIVEYERSGDLAELEKYARVKTMLDRHIIELARESGTVIPK